MFDKVYVSWSDGKCINSIDILVYTSCTIIVYMCRGEKKVHWPALFLVSWGTKTILGCPMSI